MNTDKPLLLITLLHQLLSETDKMKVGQAYIAVIEEMKRVSFVEGGNNPYPNMVYKHLIQLSIKDFIHAGRSEASAKVVNDVIEVISNADIVS
ncbi:MAG: hypothetical protein IPP30_11810 [Flavobacterium sp.]|nr:hypothetical protein [Flavobacterium sp.]